MTYRVTTRWALLLAGIGLLAGCATQSGAGAGATSTAPATTTTATGTASPCPAPAGPIVTVTEAENGQTVCARVGQRIEVFLHGLPDQPWQPITATGTALQPATSGKLALPIGVTGAAFTAVAPGSSDLISRRPLCPSPPPGGAACLAIQAFRVSVTVS